MNESNTKKEDIVVKHYTLKPTKSTKQYILNTTKTKQYTHKPLNLTKLTTHNPAISIKQHIHKTLNINHSYMIVSKVKHLIYIITTISVSNMKQLNLSSIYKPIHKTNKL